MDRLHWEKSAVFGSALLRRESNGPARGSRTDASPPLRARQRQMAARILIVDDEQLITTMIGALLDAEGYETLQGADGTDAIRLMEVAVPDVVLCDLAMPTMDGFELLRWVRGNPRVSHVPFVVLTAHGEVENRLEAMQLGADEFLTKPFDTADLITKVRHLAAKVDRAKSLGSTTSADLAGDLSEVSLADIFHILEMGRKTGRIELRRGDADGCVYFEEGRPVHAEGEGWYGDDAILRFISWQSGHFALTSGERTEERSTTRSTHDVLVEAVKLQDALEQTWEQPVELAARGERLAELTERHEPSLRRHESLVLAALDGHRTLREIAEVTGTDRFEAHSAVRTLAALGIVLGTGDQDDADPLSTLLDGAPSGVGSLRILVVDGSAPFRQALTVAVSETPDAQVIGAVSGREEAVRLVRERDPSVITLDLDLPDEPGLRALKQIIMQQPQPIIVMSALTQEGSNAAFECLRFGAVDVMAKPAAASGDEQREQISRLLEKITVAAGVQVRNIRRVRPPRHSLPTHDREGLGAGCLVAAGSGTGGVGATIRFLASLPRGIDASILVIQHVDGDVVEPLADFLGRYAPVPVRRAVNGAPLEPGVCHVACSDDYVNVEPGRGEETARLQVGDRPSLFKSTQTINWALFSIAETYGDRALAVVLAGHGEDAAKGAGEIHRLGGGCIVQAPDTCIAPEMPEAAIRLEIADSVVADGLVGEAVTEWLLAHSAGFDAPDMAE